MQFRFIYGLSNISSAVKTEVGIGFCEDNEAWDGDDGEGHTNYGLSGNTQGLPLSFSAYSADRR